MKNVVITTTFRDFKGNINDKMQIRFLTSLRRQTYQNYILVVTVFKEKNVEKIVRRILGEKAVFLYSTIDDSYRYSLSKVIINGIDYGKETGADILVDCSSDIILQNNFLETVVSNYSERYSGISHPNIFYDVNDNFEVINKRMGGCSQGIDIRFFDISLLADETVYGILRRFTFNDWGGFEHFLAAICMKYSKRRINIFKKSKIIKLENNREASQETEGFLMKSSRRNQQVLSNAARAMKIDGSRLLDLYYIHLMYSQPRCMAYLYILREKMESRKGKK